MIERIDQIAQEMPFASLPKEKRSLTTHPVGEYFRRRDDYENGGKRNHSQLKYCDDGGGSIAVFYSFSRKVGIEIGEKDTSTLSGKK